MSVRLLRESSDTPNISNKEDVRMVQYAYGRYDGVLSEYKSECGYAYDTSNGTFTIKGGRLVFHGWEVELDSQGWSMQISSGTYYLVYLEVDLTAETAKIKSVYAQGDYPEVNSGDNLDEYEYGIARMPLYKVRYDRLGSSAGTVERLFERIPSLKVVQNNLEERLNKLGFNKGQLELAYRADPQNTLKSSKNEAVKIGTNVYVNLYTSTTAATTFNGLIGFNAGERVATVPDSLIPSSDIQFFSPVTHVISGTGTYYGRGKFTLRSSDGAIIFNSAGGSNVSTITSYDINFGYCLVDIATYE